MCGATDHIITYYYYSRIISCGIESKFSDVRAQSLAEVRFIQIYLINIIVRLYYNQMITISSSITILKPN